MSPRARTGILAAAIVGGMFLVCGGAVGIAVLGRSGTKADPAASRVARGSSIQSGSRIAITGVVRGLTPANEGIEWMMQNGMALSEFPEDREELRKRKPVRSFPYAVFVMTPDGEYTCMFPPCTPEEFMKKSAHLEGRRVEVVGRKITDIGECRQLLDCQLTVAILP